jgi:hypothetical protein
MSNFIKRSRTVLLCCCFVNLYVVYDVFSMLPILVAVSYEASYLSVFEFTIS